MLTAIYSRKRQNEEGFTLIELLVVVIIIGILAAIALPIFIDQQKVAIDASVASDVRNTVTNITSAQGVSNPSAKLVKSNANTSVKVFEGTSTDADVETGGAISTPVLGITYKVEGKNAGGKKYATKVYQFNSATGNFGASDATVPAGVVVKSYNFDDGLQGWDVSNTPSTIESVAFNGRTALHLKDTWFGANNNGAHVPFSFDTKYVAGKTYKASAWVYLDPSMAFTTARIGFDNSGTNTLPFKDVTKGSWQQVSTTFVATSSYEVVYTNVYVAHNAGSIIDFYLDDVTLTQMD